MDVIDEYWSLKTNGEYALSDSGRKSVEKFLLDFSTEEIQGCIDHAFNRVTANIEGRFKYLCGILNSKLRERSHSQEFTEVLKYWNYKRPQKWKKADEGKLEHVISQYDVTTIKYYIDRLIDEDKGWADFDGLLNALNESRFD